MTWYCAHCGHPQTTKRPIPCPVCGMRTFATSLSLNVDTVQTILLPYTPEEAKA